MYSYLQTVIVFRLNGLSQQVHLNAEKHSVENTGVVFTFSEEEALSGTRWKVKVESSHVIELESLKVTASADYSLVKNFLCNGFQSWSETKTRTKIERVKGLKRIAKPIMNPFGDYTYYDYPAKQGILHSWGYTFAKLPKRKVSFVGSVNEKDAFTNFIHDNDRQQLIIDRDVKGWKVQGEVVLADLFFTVHTEFAAFQHFFMLSEFPDVKAQPAIGWTSWYHYYTKISETIVRQNLAAFQQQKLPIDIFQIDDGYQKAVGDWLQVNHKFPSGMKAIADEIREAGYKPGIWLAPLACEKNSDIFKNKPHWLMKNENGQPYKIGYNPLWSGWFYALDIYNEEVRAYVKEVFRVVCREWGFDLVKLDFLYGACLMARKGRSRGGVMHDAMLLLREVVGVDKEILGCGIPMGSAPGITDYCRIGADVHLKWEFGLLKWTGNKERVSTINALQNTIHRRQLNKHAFINDPDVFMLRKKKQSLSNSEQYTLLLTNLIFGDVLLTSDNISEYEADTMQRFRSIFPLMEKEDMIVEQDADLYKVTFRIRERHYTIYINLGDQQRNFKLPKGNYFEPLGKEITSGESTINIAGHASICFHSIGNGAFAVAGSQGHFFPGAEVEKISLKGNEIKIKLVHGLQVDPELYLKVPIDFECESVNGQPFKRIQKKDYCILIVNLKRNEKNNTAD